MHGHHLSLSCGNEHPCPHGAGVSGAWGALDGSLGEHKCSSAELEEVNGTDGAAVGFGRV